MSRWRANRRSFDADATGCGLWVAAFVSYALNLGRTYLKESIAWSTSGVLSETINKCKSAGLEFALLQPLQDVDEEKDLLNSKLQWV